MDCGVTKNVCNYSLTGKVEQTKLITDKWDEASTRTHAQNIDGQRRRHSYANIVLFVVFSESAGKFLHYLRPNIRLGESFL